MMNFALKTIIFVFKNDKFCIQAVRTLAGIEVRKNQDSSI